MTDLPSVSVIIPTRRRPRWLAQAVQSVLSQHLQAVELVVVDDASPRSDAEAALDGVRACANVPVRVVAGPGRGPAAARNTGLGMATGELVAFLDDDDWWLPQKLAWQVEWFLMRPGLGALGTSWTEAARAGLGCGLGRPPKRLRAVSLAKLVRANRLATSSVMARRDCVARLGGFDESLPLAQDWDLWLRMAEISEVAILPARLVVYRRHERQRSADKVEMRRQEAEVVGRALARLAPGPMRGVARRRLAWAHGRLGRLLAGEAKIDAAIAELKKSMELFPCNPLVWTALLRCAVAKRGLARAEP